MAFVKLLDKYIGIPICYLLWPLTKIMARNKGKNILIVKMWGMGDAVIILPVVNFLKKRMPDRKIIALATRETADVFKHEAIDEVVIFNDKV